MTDKQYCCQEFKKAVDNCNIINEDYTNGSWNPPVKYDNWYLSERDYNDYQEMYEFNAVLEPIKFCPFCGSKLDKNKDLN